MPNLTAVSGSKKLLSVTIAGTFIAKVVNPKLTSKTTSANETVKGIMRRSFLVTTFGGNLTVRTLVRNLLVVLNDSP